jgi:flagellar biosynthetic protein FlhB
MSEENSSAQERTEAPTQRRRQQAREEGRVARSQELPAAVILVGGAMLLAGVGGRSLAAFSVRALEAGAGALTSEPLTLASGTALVRMMGEGLIMALLPFLLGTAVLVLAVNLVQARGVISWKPLEPKLTNISPLTGLKRLFSLESIVTLIKAILKIAVLGLLTWMVLERSWGSVMSLAQTSAGDVLMVFKTLSFRLAAVTGFAFLAIAAGDYAFQIFRHEKSLKMTRQEVIREYREAEGDPMVKGRIQQLARSRARQRMLQAVPTADVVLVNPTHIAVALKYDPFVSPAPIVVAMGERKLAERIKALAFASGVPVLENKPIARALLATATVGKPIPPALYAAIAEILAYVYRKKAGFAASLPRASGEVFA